MPVWLLAVVLTFACAVIVYSVRCVAQATRNDTLTKISTKARVARVSGRNSNMLNHWLAGGNVSHFHNVNRELYVTFELLPDNKPVKFTIPIVQYPEIDEGDTGTLIFQGTRFISFE